jgi:hypothetical protein
LPALGGTSQPPRDCVDRIRRRQCGASHVDADTPVKAAPSSA